MSSSLGKMFVVTCFGESHGPVVGVVIDGCPAGLPLEAIDLEPDLGRRRPGNDDYATPRVEFDQVKILSGVFNGKTTGTPLCSIVHNEDTHSSFYEAMKNVPRPGHADFTSFIKYGGYADYRGGGHLSGRITTGWVMAGVVAKKLLALNGIEIAAYPLEIGGVKTGMRRSTDHLPDNIKQLLSDTRKAGDSLGGVIQFEASGIPVGWGEPVVETLDGELAKALFAIPAVKGVDFGEGFGAARLTGSENNDPFIIESTSVTTLSNRAGGILGGMSDGMPVVARVAIKPAPSISKVQRSVSLETMTETAIRVEGRHDSCIVPRAVVVVEAMAAIVLCDLGLRAAALPRVIK